MLLRVAGEALDQEALGGQEQDHDRDGEDHRAAMRIVLGISMPASSCDRPSETDKGQGPQLWTRKSRANRNPFQAIMNTNKLVAMIASLASGRLTSRITCRRSQPSVCAASSRLTGTVSNHRGRPADRPGGRRR